MHLHSSSPSRLIPLSAVTIALVVLSGCAAPTRESAPTPSGDTYGSVEGAVELSEAQLSLVSGSSDGALTVLDLVSEVESEFLQPTESNVVDVTGDGRFLFRVEQTDAETSVQVVNSGVWTVEHGDHFHYHRTDPRTIGSVTGTGPAVVHTADRRTAITFPESGEVVVLAHDDLEEGSIGTPERMSIKPHTGALALPFGGALLVTAPDEVGSPSTVEVITADGDAPLATTPCADATSATLTRVGAVFTCAIGAVLATVSDGEITLEAIPYPAGVDAPPATSLQGRAGRPSVAGIAGAMGAWRLDTRTREWVFLPRDTPLLTVSAVSDDANLTVAVDSTGRILVFDATGATLAVTEPVLAESVANPLAKSHVRLIVDAQRAYVSDPAQNRVLEIDYRDNARIARTFTVSDATFLEQVG